MPIKGFKSGFERRYEGCARCSKKISTEPEQMSAWAGQQMGDSAHPEDSQMGVFCGTCGPMFMDMVERWLEGKVEQPQPQALCKNGHKATGSFCYTCYTGVVKKRLGI